MPCSGLKSATSERPGALWNRSMVGVPSAARPVWLVMSPTLRPCSGAKPSRTRTSIPLSTRVVGMPPTGRAGSDEAPKSVPVVRISVSSESVWPPTSADAAMVATRARSAVTSPVPSGCKRLDRKMTKSCVCGSTQIDVPVNPVWPNDPSGMSSPRLAEKLVSRSQPRPRCAGIAGGVAGVIILATVSGASTRRGAQGAAAEQHAHEPGQVARRC